MVSLSRAERPDSECKVPVTTCARSLAPNLGIANENFHKPSPRADSLGARRFSEVGSEFEGSCFELLLPCQNYPKGSLNSESVFPGVCSELLTPWWTTRELGLEGMCVTSLDVARVQGSLLLSSEKLNKMKSCRSDLLSGSRVSKCFEEGGRTVPESLVWF